MTISTPGFMFSCKNYCFYLHVHLVKRCNLKDSNLNFTLNSSIGLKFEDLRKISIFWLAFCSFPQKAAQSCFSVRSLVISQDKFSTSGSTLVIFSSMIINETVKMHTIPLFYKPQETDCKPLNSLC